MNSYQFCCSQDIFSLRRGSYHISIKDKVTWTLPRGLVVIVTSGQVRHIGMKRGVGALLQWKHRCRIGITIMTTQLSLIAVPDPGAIYLTKSSFLAHLCSCTVGSCASLSVCLSVHPSGLVRPTLCITTSVHSNCVDHRAAWCTTKAVVDKKQTDYGHLVCMI